MPESKSNKNNKTEITITYLFFNKATTSDKYYIGSGAKKTGITGVSFFPSSDSAIISGAIIAFSAYCGFDGYSVISFIWLNEIGHFKVNMGALWAL